MKKHGLKWALSLLLFSAILARLSPVVTGATPAPVEPSIDEMTRQRILASTLRILMFFPVEAASSRDVDNQSSSNAPGQEAEQTVRYTAAVGMGTLISHEGDLRIVTHDHWGHPFMEIALVEFRDATDALFLELDGQAFKALIRYRDGGTMILDAPAGLEQLAPAESASDFSTANHRPVQAGGVVVVVRQRPGDENKADILQAEVVSVNTRQGVTTFELSSLGGEPIVKGDSGGGVFLNGQLVGNLWSTEVATAKRYLGFLTINSDKTGTDQSTAAGLSRDHLDS